VLSAHRAYRTKLLEQLQAELPRTEFSEAFFLGLLHLLRGPDRLAETNLVKACRLSPRSRDAGVALRYFYRSQGDRPAAERLDRAIRSLAPGPGGSPAASGSLSPTTPWQRAVQSTLCRLPWAAGRAFYCASHEDRLVTPHSGRGQYALDFLLPMATPILAARRGTVIEVSDRHTPMSRRDFDTWLVVDHGDGTYARYYHLRGGTARVSKGQAVRQGEPLAQAGRTGACQSRHLHFEVVRKAPLRLNGTRIYNRWETVPVRFEEVRNFAPGQIPGRWLVSGNQPAP
jgi:murein DD-endopeptidase MepM/ murein hydrolase activator NlpD